MLTRSVLRWFAHIHWIRFGIRDRLLRMFHNPDTAKAETFEVSFFGKRYCGDFSTFLDWSVYYYGAYSGEELSLMNDAVKGLERPVIYDIGANIGHHTLFASTLSEEVHAFEPFPLVREKIQEKIKVNSISNVTVHGIGLGDKNETLPYFPPDNSNTGTGTFVNTASPSLTSVLLPIHNGDSYFKELNLPKPDFIKMDIEGFEPQALQGIKHTLTQYRPIVFFEWSANERLLSVDIISLFPEKYKIFSFLTNQPVLGIFNKSSYRLYENTAAFCSDGNKVAIPIESIDRFHNNVMT